MLILPVHEQDISFHSLVFCSVSYFSDLQFSEYRSFISLVKFIPRYLILMQL